MAVQPDVRMEYSSFEFPVQSYGNAWQEYYYLPFEQSPQPQLQQPYLSLPYYEVHYLEEPSMTRKLLGPQYTGYDARTEKFRVDPIVSYANSPWNQTIPHQAIQAPRPPLAPLEIRLEDPSASLDGQNGYSSGRRGSSDQAGEFRKAPVRSTALPPDVREKANDVRAVGACLRCWYFRESCDTNDTCKRCGSHFRTWPHRDCIRIKFKEMWLHLQPAQLGQHLEYANVTAFIKQNRRQQDYSNHSLFVLPLSWGLGKPLKIDVIEIEPSTNKLTEHDALRTRWYTKDHVEITPFPMNSPPLIADLSSREQLLSIQNKIKALLNELMHDEDAGVIWQCFWDEQGDTYNQWHREVFFAIWQYHQPEIKEHGMLGEALRLLILIHFMTKSLVVPEQDVSELLDHLKNPEKYDREAPFSPKAINQAVKMCAYPLIKHLAQTTMKNLQALVQNRSESCMAKDLTFCLAFISLAVAGKNQGAAVDRALIRRNSEIEGVDLDEDGTTALILDMEANFTESVIKLCQCRFKPSQKPSKPAPQCQSEGEAHAEEFELLSHVEKQTREAGDDLHIRMEISRHLDDFSATNTKRVLVKFIAQVFPSWIIRRTSAPTHSLMAD